MMPAQVLGTETAELDLDAGIDDAADQARIVLTARRVPQGDVGRPIRVLLGGVELLRTALPEPGEMVEGLVSAEALKALASFGVELRDADDQPMDASGLVLRGQLFEALSLSSDAFFEKVQLHHTRYRSKHLLEIAARVTYLRHPRDFVVRASALTIMAHRYLERPGAAVNDAEAERIGWLRDEAERVVPEGSALIAAAQATHGKIDWRHVRWTISLATVAGYLCLYDESYRRALEFFRAAGKHTSLVGVARVSALNLVTTAFAGGLIAHMLDLRDEARSTLVRGVESVKDSVAAQNLLENVWVLGDLQNVLKAARQCYVALLRLGLIELRASPPMIDDATQILTSEVRGPLRGMVVGGRVPTLARHLTQFGGK